MDGAAQLSVSGHTGLAGIHIAGDELYALAAEIYPICRSISGNGVRRTLAILGQHAPITVHDVPSGTQVLDWTTPKEWNIRAAWIANSRGERIVDFAHSSLHVLNYSAPVRARMSLAELRPHLFSLPDKPALIPYLTSYYAPGWGFCLPYDQLKELPEDTYEVVIDAEQSQGSLTYGEIHLPGETDDEIMLSAHICHPSLANDNCSGLALLTLLARELALAPRRYSYRILLAPGTIGAITWLARNRDTVHRVKHGLIISNVGDGGGPTYKKSQRGDAEIDRAMSLVLREAAIASTRIDEFTPYGYDERQYCSPGFDLAVGSFQRSRWGEFPEYHTSADNLDFIRPEHLERSASLVVAALDVIEQNAVWRNLSPYGEPQLGKHGLYDAGPDGRVPTQAERMALLWVLNQTNGARDLLEIAERAKLPFSAIAGAADRLATRGLLARVRST